MNIRNANNGVPFLTWEQEFHCMHITSMGKHSSCLAGCGVWFCVNNPGPLKEYWNKLRNCFFANNRSAGRRQVQVLILQMTLVQ